MVFSIPRLIEYACEKNNVSELYETITFKFNNRFTKKLGDANPNTRVIRLSSPLWERATEDQKKEVIVHEVCHLIAQYKAWMQKTYILDLHGAEWRAAMKNVGYNDPSQYHTINREGIARKYASYYVQCSCAKRRVNSNMYVVILEQQWHCDKCGEVYRADQ
jgi:predicted SprT family Zn-dependent metalloprotease